MTTKSTRTETDTSPQGLNLTPGAQITESLDGLIEGVRQIRKDLDRERREVSEFQIKPWHLLVAVWLGAVAAVAGAQTANKLLASERKVA